MRENVLNFIKQTSRYSLTSLAKRNRLIEVNFDE